MTQSNDSIFLSNVETNNPSNGTLPPIIGSKTYYTPGDNAFDIVDFNKKFDIYLDQEKAKRIITEQKFLEAKDFERKEKQLHEYTFIELLVNMKDALFDILDDIASFNITSETFTKNNRLFYLGLLMIIFAVTLICVKVIFNSHNQKKE